MASKAPSRPQSFLGRSLILHDLASLAIAVGWIAWLRFRVASHKSTLDAKIAALKEKSAKDLVLTIEGEAEPVPADIHLKELEQAVTDYCHQNAKSLFVGKKNFDTAAGNIAASKHPITLVITDPELEESKLVDKIIEKVDLLPEIARLQAEFPDAFPYLRFEIKLNKTAILDAYKAKTLTDADLAEHGLQAKRPENDKITIKV